MGSEIQTKFKYNLRKKPTTTRPRPWTMQPIGSLQAGALHTEKVLQQISEQVARLASAVSNISSALEERVTHAGREISCVYVVNGGGMKLRVRSRASDTEGSILYEECHKV